MAAPYTAIDPLPLSMRKRIADETLSTARSFYIQLPNSISTETVVS